MGEISDLPFAFKALQHAAQAWQWLVACFLCIDGVRHSHLTCQIPSLYTNTQRLKLSPLCVCDSCAKVAQ